MSAAAYSCDLYIGMEPRKMPKPDVAYLPHAELWLAISGRHRLQPKQEMVKGTAAL